jgi:CYTH domain-containing protein
MTDSIELEKTYLARYLPGGLEKCRSKEIIDIYIPGSSRHPKIRIRKCGNKLELTKKEPVSSNDASNQIEHTINLTAEEYAELSRLKGKRLRKIRYFYAYGGSVAEIDIFKDDLDGLVLVDFEFPNAAEKDRFQIPDFCLVDVTQEEFVAGGKLCGARYSEIEPLLAKFNYTKINNP